MLRQIIASIVTAAIVSASVLIPSVARAHQTFEQCIQEAGAQYGKDKANGVDPVSAAAWWQAAIDQCKSQYHR
jgi:phosphohistidine phosphatase SixA